MSDLGFGMPVTYDHGPVGADPAPTTATTESCPTVRAKIFGRNSSGVPVLVPSAMNHLDQFPRESQGESPKGTLIRIPSVAATATH